MASCKQSDHDFSAGERSIALTLAYLKMACPEIDPRTRTEFANSILTLINDKHNGLRQKRITDARVVEMVWRHSQCVLNQRGRCPLLVFGKQLADEINAFFNEDE